MLKKISFLGLIFIIMFFFFFSFFKIEKMYNYSESMIALTINGSSTTNFPNKDSGYAIDSILCDKDATGVWDYESWTLKIRNVTQSRTKCQINFVSRYSESILNGTDPVLKEGLIPVIIENDGTVKKASLGWEWYKYTEQRWANAVILNDETEVYYDGDVIPEDAIESYFVWIPRYKYKIFDMGAYEGLTTIENKSQIIDLVFGTDTTTDTSSSCASPGESGESGNCSVGKYMTHPAFLVFGTKGMWVGKFETGYKGAITTSEAEKNENNPSKIQIKPNVYSWRGIQVANAYLSSYNYKREMDSHMMKNTEWGAVAYLQHSIYGSHTSVRINNNASYMTGYASKKEATCGYTGVNEECNQYENIDTLGADGIYTVNYFNSASNVASTTGNYSGVFDMSGGVWEYVMGVMLDSTNTFPCTGNNASLNAGFNGLFCYEDDSLTNGISNFPEDVRYYDTYVYSTVDVDYNRRILGDAIGEMGPFAIKKYGIQNRPVGSWYDDEAWFASSWVPWLLRGGGFPDGIGTGAGIFTFGRYYGNAFNFGSFRVVLSM